MNKEKIIVNSWNEWDPLKHVIIGRADGCCIPAPEPALLTITVPAGAQPGQQIQIKAPDGRVVAVTIPNGLQEGSQFQVKI